MGPVFKKLTDPEKEHDGSCRVEIASQHGNRDRGRIEDLDFQFSSCKLSDSFDDIRNRLDRSPYRADRSRKEDLCEASCETLSHKLFLEFLI